MFYVSNAIGFTKSHPRLLVRFVLLSLLATPFQMMRHTGIAPGITVFMLELSAHVVSLFFLSGLYAITWRSFAGSNLQLQNLVTESKKYFFPLLVLTLCLGAVGFAAISVSFVIHKSFFLPDSSALDYHGLLIRDLIRIVASFLMSDFFVYTIPLIYVENMSGARAFAAAWQVLRKRISDSLPVIFMLTAMFAIRAGLSPAALKYDFSTLAYWVVRILEASIVLMISFHVFLVSCQILREKHAFL